MRRQSPQRGAHSPRADGHFFFVAMAFGVLPFVTSLILGRPMQALVAGVIQHGAAAGYRGFDVRETATGRDTLRLARLQVHAIVLDLVLSDMNGYEVLRKMKDDPATHNIPVIMKTAVHVDDGHREVALGAGASEYLAEPFDPETFVAAVRRVLDDGRDGDG